MTIHFHTLNAQALSSQLPGRSQDDLTLGSLPWWADAASQLHAWLRSRNVVIAQAVVLLPSSQLAVLMQQAWDELGTPAPRITTLPGLVASLGDQRHAPGQLTMNLATDALLARRMLLGLSWGRERLACDAQGFENAARALALTAQELARACASRGPVGLSGSTFWQQARAVLKSNGAGSSESEQMLALVAAEWAAQSPAPLTDVLFEAQPSAWLLVQDVMELDPLISALMSQAQHKTPCAVFHTLQPDNWAQMLPSGQASLTVCEDFEDEAQCVAACVLHQLEGRSHGDPPLALIAEDRLLIRRISALLRRRHVDVLDEAGWKLSTTRAASMLNNLLRACAPKACSDDWLQWLADCPACAPGGEFEQALMQLDRYCRQTGVHELAVMRATARAWALAVQDLLTWAQAAVALLAPHQALRLEQWLSALQAGLVHAGTWDELQADPAGQQLCVALFGADGGNAHRQYLEHDLTWDEFGAWLDHTLESAHFQAPRQAGSTGRPAVVVTTLAQAVLRPFATVIFPGADSRTLGSISMQRPLLSLLQAQTLGLPNRAQIALAQHQQLAHLLQRPVLRFFRRRQDGKDPVAESPLLEALALRMARAGQVLLDEQRRFDVRAFPVPLPAPALPSSSRSLPSAPDLLPTRLSAQSAEALRACPYRFFVHYVLGLREDDALSGLVQKRDYGDVLHRVLERFHAHRHKPPGPAQAEEKQLHQWAQDIRLEMNLDEAQWLPFAASFARLVPRYVAWLHERDAQNATWLHGEHDMRVPLEGLDGLELFGRIDRIDQQLIKGEQGQVSALQVIDYKTGSPEPLKQRLKNPQEDTQLVFYAALLAQQQRGAPVQAAYLLLDTPDAPQLLAHDDVQNTAQLLVAGLAHDVQRLRAGHGMPALGEGSDCQFCAARGVCRRDDWS